MERIFHHYEKWEDYQAGMYENQPETKEAIQNAIRVLSNPRVCEEAMYRVVTEWRYATEFNLSNTGCQRPWMGRAAVCITHGVSENITRIAWWQLLEEEQIRANEIADRVISKWKAEYQFTNEAPNLFSCQS